MIKTTLKRIFAIVGSGLAPVAAILYFVIGINSVISVSSAFDAKTNIFLIIEFLLCFALAFLITFYGGKVLFSFLNNENNADPFAMLVLCFTVFQFVQSLLSLCFWGSSAATWVILIFSLVAALTLILHVSGIKVTWYTDVVGVGMGMITAMTAACAGQGLALVAAIIVSVIFFLVMAIFALHLIKSNEEEKKNPEEK